MNTDGLLERLRRQDLLVIALKQVIVAQEHHIAELQLRLVPAAADATIDGAGGFLRLLRAEICVGLHDDGWLAPVASLVFSAPQPGRSIMLEFFLPPAAGVADKTVSVEAAFADTAELTIERDTSVRYVRRVPDNMRLPPVLFIRSDVPEQPTLHELRDLGVLLVDITVD